MLVVYIVWFQYGNWGFLSIRLLQGVLKSIIISSQSISANGCILLRSFGMEFGRKINWGYPYFVIRPVFFSPAVNRSSIRQLIRVKFCRIYGVISK